MKSALLMGFLGLLLMISSGKLLADPAFSAVYKMPADIEWADSLCPWKSATETGYLRLVRSRDDDRHRLLVQWIRKSMNEQPDEAVSPVLLTSWISCTGCAYSRHRRSYTRIIAS